MPASTCPNCQQNDAVQAVSTVVSGGASTSSGFAVGYAAGHVGGAVLTSQSQTGLAYRLSPPTAPGTMSGARLVLPTLLFIVAAAVASAAIWHSADKPDLAVDGVWWMTVAIMTAFTAVPAAVVGFAVFMPLWWLAHRRPAAKRRWQRHVNYLYNNAFYCGRDDVIFDSEGDFGRPEAYIASLFALA